MIWAVMVLLTSSSGGGSRGVGESALHGGTVDAGDVLAVYARTKLRYAMPLPREAAGTRGDIGNAGCTFATTAAEFSVGLSAPSPAAATNFLLVRELGPAPRSLRHRILVTPPPTRRHWTSMELAEAACCLLGRTLRSVHLRVIVTLGSFSVYLAFVFIVLGPAGATAAILLVHLIAPIPRSPVG